MILADLVLGAHEWRWPAIIAAAVALAMLVWAYARAGSQPWVRFLAGVLKAAGIILLALCLVEPMFQGNRPKPGTNLFLVLADNSRSLQLAERGSRQTRGQLFQARLAEKSPWLTRVAQDFDLRRYAFDTTLRPVKDFAELPLDGQASAMQGSLTALADRFRGQPVAGILLFSDGNATDLPATLDWQGLPPIYPVLPDDGGELVDLSVARVNVSQTNFEAAPVTLTAEIEGQSVAGKKIVVRVLDESGKEVERRSLLGPAAGEPAAQRFLIKPEKPHVSFYTVQAFLDGEEGYEQRPGRTAEATLANNRRLATVDRGGGPYRVLYVAGRPNWEFKFLRRAIEEDDEVTLVGLLRIAKKEPKFTFKGQIGERTNPLFRGFGNQNDATAEQYDQPVLLRVLDTEKAQELQELKAGFPKDPEDMFRYHAVILDDVEAAFFTQDQLSLLQKFVSQRGGGFLMLGGPNSFADGNYQRTPVGEMLPVYLDRTSAVSPPEGFRLKLTREGWLQPWVRVRTNEPDEEKRLAAMPAFKTVSRVDAIKPGASVLAQVELAGGEARPALVVQPFGRGRTAALLVGDLWRWNLRRENHKESDLDKSWRQMIRWLVADVPQPVEVETRRSSGTSLPGVEIVVRARDKQFAPLDNAGVSIKVETPDKRNIELVAESSAQAPGEYVATFAPREAGAYRAQIAVTAADGSDVGSRQTGWAVEPETEEFRTLAVNRPLLERLAKETGGEIVAADGLESFVASLPNRKIPVVESWTYPLWHQWQMFLAAVVCLIGEWGLRRWRGLP